MKVFLKYNKHVPTSNICLERWLKVFQNDDVYIITDIWSEDKMPEYTDIIPKIRLHDYKVRNRDDSLAEKYKNIVGETVYNFNPDYIRWDTKPSDKWFKALAANLVCFDIAKDDEYCWIIDADDIVYIVHDYAALREKFRAVEQIAIEQNLDGISQNMYRDWADHWSFGVAFLKPNLNLEPMFTITEEEYANNGMGSKQSIDVAFDIMRTRGTYNLKSFVLDNVPFVHADQSWPIYGIWTNRTAWHGLVIKDDIISVP